MLEYKTGTKRAFIKIDEKIICVSELIHADVLNEVRGDGWFVEIIYSRGITKQIFFGSSEENKLAALQFMEDIWKTILEGAK